MPAEILFDIRKHVGDDKKFVSVADAIRTACRKLLDQLDEIDIRTGDEIMPTRDEAKEAVKTLLGYLEKDVEREGSSTRLIEL